jgi:hypothetical protein
MLYPPTVKPSQRIGPETFPTRYWILKSKFVGIAVVGVYRGVLPQTDELHDEDAIHYGR